MSMVYSETVKCPQCGCEKQIAVWRSLNSDREPQAKAQLMNGTLFGYKCDGCGWETNLFYPILYHDMQNNAMVYCVPEQEAEEAKKTFAAAEDMVEDKIPGYRNRVVTDHNALREKAIIFDAGMDDRVIELVKIVYASAALKQGRAAEPEKAYYRKEGGKNFLEFVGDTPFGMEFDQTLYDRIAADFAKLFEQNTDCVIDTQWAYDMLKQKGAR